ncbi:MAG: hypothetical protein B7Z80_10330 [Rhodospirillales bacterium 20-64-7]|nr:MAG: hypothetical protein B7Z80_10330 [Rhodospirillales bacterium 20-64-7]
MPVYQSSQFNSSGAGAPDLYVVIQPPQQSYVNGIPTDGLGLVGVGSWGPVNQPVTITGQPFGPITVRSHDIATAAAIAQQLGSVHQVGVRVTDGTDAKATADLMDTAPTPVIGMILTAKYSGVLGNQMTAAITAGTAASTNKLTVSLPGYAQEVYDNIAGTGATFWSNAVAAVMNGQNGLRGPSSVVVAAVGASVAAPNTTAVVQFAGGTDGAAITDAILVGSTGVIKTGMYALSNAGVQVGNIVDLTTPTTWPSIASFGMQSGIMFHVSNARATSIAASVTALATSGVDSYAMTCLVGNWVAWYDTLNGVIRSIAPATFTSALQASLSPEQSILNKIISNIVALDDMTPYDDTAIMAAVQGRVEMITWGIPASSGAFGCRVGQNTSSDPTRNGDNYSRMTNYIAYTIASAYGRVIGQPQTKGLRQSTKASLDAFFSNMDRNNMIGNVNASTQPGWNVQLDASNNPTSQVALGDMQANITVTYLSIVRRFIAYVQGGQTVTVTPTA